MLRIRAGSVVVALLIALAPCATSAQAPTQRPTTVQPVPALPPDTLPAWIFADSNIVGDSALTRTEFRKNVLWLAFETGTSMANRVAAIRKVNGTVVGGKRMGEVAEGAYYVRPARGATVSQLFAAAKDLQGMPGVIGASPILAGGRESDISRVPPGPSPGGFPQQLGSMIPRICPVPGEKWDPVPFSRVDLGRAGLGGTDLIPGPRLDAVVDSQATLARVWRAIADTVPAPRVDLRDDVLIVVASGLFYSHPRSLEIETVLRCRTSGAVVVLLGRHGGDALVAYFDRSIRAVLVPRKLIAVQRVRFIEL